MILIFTASKMKPSGELFNTPPLTSCFVKKQINSISTTIATGLDKVPVRLLKLCVNEVADSLTNIINLSFETATFPEIWKIARVTPIYKSGDKSVQLNYRPISVLPVISKTCERHVHVTFLSWLQKFRLLIGNQSAYLNNHSCVTALIDITDTLLLNMDRGDINGLLMLDLSKAFDLINHNLLLKKLEIYGLSESTLGWFNSYLSMRKQAVAVNGTASEFLDISRGVPQGSILGPLLFITFMNDLSFEINDPQKLKMFADDSTILVAGRTLEYVNQQLANCLKPISSWIGNHGMALNVAKTESMIICTRPKLARLQGQRIQITHNGTAIKSVDSHKLLGLVLDEQLTWNSHTDEVCSRVLKRINLLKAIKTYLPQVQPLIDYACVIWGATSQYNLDRILRLQKYAARVILNILKRPHGQDVPSSELFSKLNWMIINKRVDYFTSIMMYKTINKSTPSYLHNRFEYVKDKHQTNTRPAASENLFIPISYLLRQDKGLSCTGE